MAFGGERDPLLLQQEGGSSSSGGGGGGSSKRNSGTRRVLFSPSAEGQPIDYDLILLLIKWIREQDGGKW